MTNAEQGQQQAPGAGAAKSVSENANGPGEAPAEAGHTEPGVQSSDPAAANEPKVESENSPQPSPESDAVEAPSEQTSEQTRALEAEIKALQDQCLRAQADVENIRKRAQTEVANARKYALEGFASEILSVKDSLDLARTVDLDSGDVDVVKKVSEGLDLTVKQLEGAMRKFSIEEIDPSLGDRLDPERHQAMTIEETHDVEPNCICKVIQKGYALHDRLLRPAMVIVAKAPKA
jgi:molecular chaperone GrpE